MAGTAFIAEPATLSSPAVLIGGTYRRTRRSRTNWPVTG